MNDEMRGELTLGQQRFIERMQEAQNEGVSLADYYRAHGLRRVVSVLRTDFLMG